MSIYPQNSTDLETSKR